MNGESRTDSGFCRRCLDMICGGCLEKVRTFDREIASLCDSHNAYRFEVNTAIQRYHEVLVDLVVAIREDIRSTGPFKITPSQALLNALEKFKVIEKGK